MMIEELFKIVPFNNKICLSFKTHKTNASIHGLVVSLSLYSSFMYEPPYQNDTTGTSI